MELPILVDFFLSQVKVLELEQSIVIPFLLVMWIFQVAVKVDKRIRLCGSGDVILE